MIHLLLNTIALEPNRWTPEKTPYFRLEELLDPVAAAGFQHLEIWQYHLTTRTPEDIASLAQRMSDANLSARIIGMYPNLHVEGTLRRRELDTMRKAIDAANVLGAHTIKIFVGMKASASLNPDEYRRSVDFARELAAHLHQLGLHLTGETHANTLFDTPESLVRFMKDVDAPNFHVCFQPYDFSSTSSTLDLYRMVADRVTHVHLQGRENDAMSLLEEADIDYSRFLSVLRDDRFAGDLCIEFVKDCVVDRPEDFAMRLVLENAVKDRRFVESVFEGG